MTGTAVIVKRVGHGADDREFISPLGKPGKVLRDQEFRIPRRDRLERASDLLGSVRLHIKRFKLTRSTEQENKNDRLRPWLDRVGLGRFRSQTLGQIQAHQARTGGLQHGSARHGMTGSGRHALNFEHVFGRL